MTSLQATTRLTDARRSSHFVGLGLLVMFLGGLLLASTLYERAYAGRMYPGVTVLSLDLSGKTLAAARSAVTDRVTSLLDRPIALQFTDGSEELISARMLSLSLDAAALVDAAFARGRTGSILERWTDILSLQTESHALAAGPSFDTDHILAALESSLVAHEVAPTDATLVEDGGTLRIAPDAAGSRIDRAALAVTIETHFMRLDIPATLPIPSEAVMPTITTATLEPILAEARRLVATPLVLTARDRTLTISSAMLASWVRADTSQAPIALTWSEEAITTYLGTIAKQVDIPMKPRTLNAQNAAVLSEGTVGWRLNRAQASAAIEAALATRAKPASLQKFSTAPIGLTVDEVPIEEKLTVPAFTPGLYAGKYLEINLTEQALYQWEGETMVASYPVSTGKWGTPTPEGVLYIKNHISYAYSRKYDLYMPWWLGLSFNPDGTNYQGYGIHELPEWRGGKKEGESHLGTPVSHGCIRLGVGPAQAIYDWAEEGMPVYIHR